MPILTEKASEKRVDWLKKLKSIEEKERKAWDVKKKGRDYALNHNLFSSFKMKVSAASAVQAQQCTLLHNIGDPSAPPVTPHSSPEALSQGRPRRQEVRP